MSVSSQLLLLLPFFFPSIWISCSAASLFPGSLFDLSSVPVTFLFAKYRTSFLVDFLSSSLQLLFPTIPIPLNSPASSFGVFCTLSACLLHIFSSHTHILTPLKAKLNRRCHGCGCVWNIRASGSLRSSDEEAFQVKGNNNKASNKQITQRHKPDKQTKKGDNKRYQNSSSTKCWVIKKLWIQL